MRRTTLAAAAALLLSTIVGVTATPAHADPEAGTALPPGPVGTAWFVKVSDGVVWATWGSTQDTATLYRTAADGSGTWDQVLDPSTSAALVDPAVIGDGIVVPKPVTAPGDPCPTYRVVTGTTAWTVPDSAGGCAAPVLGTGDDLVAVGTQGPGVGQAVYDVYDAVTGPAGGVLKHVSGQKPALDGHWVLTMTPFAVFATDTTGQHAQVRAPIPAGCDFGQVAKAVGDPTGSDGYALVDCTSGAGALQGTFVVPLDGRMPFHLPAPLGLRNLGNGFSTTIHGDVSGVVSVFVADFSRAETTHTYGTKLVRAAPSDSGTPMEVWRESGQVYTATLDWLGAPPTPADDSTPPAVGVDSPQPAVRLATATRDGVTFGWEGFTDQFDQLVFDVETRSSAEGPGWHAAFYSRKTFSREMTFFENRAVTRCVRVRAEDRAGNLSDWVSSCTRVDDARPTMRFQPDPRHSVVTDPGQTVVRFPLRGSDDGPIVSYQVERRIGTAGGSWKPWRTKRSWRAVTDPHVDQHVGRHQEICFRARATDEVGRVSQWGKPWCRTTPYDDAALEAHDVRRIRDADLLGGGASVLGAHGALTLRGLSGREIWVRARGRETECPHVSWGGRPFIGGGHPCSFSRAQHGFRWYSWRVRAVQRGPIRIESPLLDPVTVDAVAVVH